MKDYTIETFKIWAARQSGFDFVKYPMWEEGKEYSTGDRVIALDSAYKFAVFESLEDENFDNPNTATEERAESDVDLTNVILDSDIEEAMREANFKFNERLFDNEEEKTTAYSLLVAFYLVYDKQLAQDGTNSGYSGLPASKKIGEMSISYMADPALASGSQQYAFFARNKYGLKYWHLVSTRMKAMKLVLGRTTNI